MPNPIFLEKPATEAITVSLEPARSALNSMVLLSHDEDTSGLDEWIRKTRSQFTQEEKFRNRLVILGFFYAVAPEAGWSSFPAYLEHLEKIDPEALKAKLLYSYSNVKSEISCNRDQATGELDWQQILSSAANYVEFLKCSFGEENVDPEVEAKAYEYLLDPPVMKKLIVDHLYWVWDKFLAAEWKRVEGMLEASVRAFQNVDLNNMDRLEAARFVTGQDLDETKWECLKEAKHIVFIPNAHIGPFVSKYLFSDSLEVIFRPRVPEKSDVHVPELDRAEIVIRLAALADDTRLQIMKMVADKGDVRVQDIMDQLGLSQPTVSRNLMQLSATGYLQERRNGLTKVYVLNRERFDKNMNEVSSFLFGNK